MHARRVPATNVLAIAALKIFAYTSLDRTQSLVAGRKYYAESHVQGKFRNNSMKEGFDRLPASDDEVDI
jgi:hypothetical protein